MTSDIAAKGSDSRGKAAALKISLFYCASGFISLAYQVTWFRIYVDRFGSTNLTFILVLSNFIAGLGAGALVSRSFSRWLSKQARLKDAFRVYGVIELLVAVTVLFTVFPGMLAGDIGGVFPYLLEDGVYVQTPTYELGKIALATLCVFIPCVFMGVTFPLLCDVFREYERFPSSLYAWNTVGACSGVLVCQFIAIPWIGHVTTFWLAAGLNALLGTYFLIAGGAPARGTLESRPASHVANDRRTSGESSAENVSLLLACAVLSGLLSGAIEGEMFRRIKFVGYYSHSAMAFSSFWAILGIFLASLTVRLTPTLRLIHIKLAYLLALAAFALVGLNAYTIHDWVVSLVAPPDAITTWALFFPMRQSQVLLFSGIFIFPSYFLVSLLLPFICNRIQAQGRHLGLAYGLNTVAFCLGIIVFTWVAPQVSIFYSIKLMLVVFAIGTVFLWTLSETRSLAAWKPIAAVTCVLAAAVLTPSTFDARLLKPGSPAVQYPVRAMKGSSAQTTYVVGMPSADLLYYDNMSLSNTMLHVQTYMRLMAHFPLLAQEHPTDALLICYGVGNTASAIASHEQIERIDVVELNENVIATAPEFGHATNDVHADERVHFIHDDGRNFLKRTDRVYDLITSEPPPPLHEGVYRLYSLEYYRDALAHLSPEGMMTQWLPNWQLPPEAVDRIISTFIEVFPNAILFAGWTNELILVGSPAPIDLARLERRFHESSQVQSDLARLGVPTPVALLARMFKGESSLRREYAGHSLIRDAHNDLANLYLDPGDHGVIPYDPVEMLDELRAYDLESMAELESILMHLGRLVYHAPVFPSEVLSQIPVRDNHDIALAGADWEKIEGLLELDGRSRSTGADRRSRPFLQQALALADQQLPAQLLELGRYELSFGRGRSALPPLRRFVELEPKEALGHWLLGQALANLRQDEEAVRVLEQSVQLAPDNGNARAALGFALARQGQLERARDELRAALALSPLFSGEGVGWRERVERKLESIEASIEERGAQGRGPRGTTTR
jgi:predicted membrane-bound spermidine synthase